MQQFLLKGGLISEMFSLGSILSKKVSNYPAKVVCDQNQVSVLGTQTENKDQFWYQYRSQTFFCQNTLVVIGELDHPATAKISPHPSKDSAAIQHIAGYFNRSRSVQPKPLFWFQLRYQTQSPNWQILSADTITETTF